MSNAWPRVGRVMLLGLLVLTLCTLAFPFVIAVITSIKTPGEVLQSPPTWWPQHVQLSNYVDMFDALDLMRALKVSLIVSIATAAMTTLVTLPCSYALARWEFPGRRIFMFAVLSGLTFSPVVIVVSLYQLLNSAGLINNYLALIMPDVAFSLPFSIWLCVAYIKTIPSELDEAAVLDGASMWQVLTKIILPVALPAVATIAIFAFIQSWNEFLFANTFITADAKKTLPVTLYSLVGQRGVQWQLLMAAIVFATVPAVALFLFVQRWIVSGLASGAVRG